MQIWNFEYFLVCSDSVGVVDFIDATSRPTNIAD